MFWILIIPPLQIDFWIKYLSPFELWELLFLRLEFSTSNRAHPLECRGHESIWASMTENVHMWNSALQIKSIRQSKFPARSLQDFQKLKQVAKAVEQVEKEKKVSTVSALQFRYYIWNWLTTFEEKKPIGSRQGSTFLDEYACAGCMSRECLRSRLFSGAPLMGCQCGFPLGVVGTSLNGLYIGE